MAAVRETVPRRPQDIGEPLSNDSDAVFSNLRAGRIPNSQHRGGSDEFQTGPALPIKLGSGLY